MKYNLLAPESNLSESKNKKKTQGKDESRKIFYTSSNKCKMETSSFDEQIFQDFSGPLSPLGAKQITQGHSIHVMLGMNPGSSDMCNQRLPEVQSLLPGSPKLNHYKTLDYMGNKIDYNTKITSYSSTPPPKYDYVNGKVDQYSPNHLNKVEYGKPMDYNLNAKIDYGNGKLEYDPHMQMYQQSSIPGPPTSTHQITTSQSIESPSMNDKKKNESCDQSDNQSVSQSDASSTSKKNDKKKGDLNGVKKKKTRYVHGRFFVVFFVKFDLIVFFFFLQNNFYGFPIRRIGTSVRTCSLSRCFCQGRARVEIAFE